jgi:hypothetical protein
MFRFYTFSVTNIFLLLQPARKLLPHGNGPQAKCCFARQKFSAIVERPDLAIVCHNFFGDSHFFGLL